MLDNFSQIPIPSDAVDDRLAAHPAPWRIGEIRRIILFIGPILPNFDFTYLTQWVKFAAEAEMDLSANRQFLVFRSLPA
jgi:Mg2+-importing ATPase